MGYSLTENQGLLSYVKCPLSKQRLDSCQRVRVRVSKWSIIRARKNSYSVSSPPIGSHVQVRIYAEWVELWSAQKLLGRVPRLHGND